MKQILRYSLRAIAVLALLAALAAFFLHQPETARAQSPGVNASAPVYKTNRVPTTWTTVTAAANSNVVGFGNSGGYTAPAAVRLPYQQPMALWANFQCATVTLANVAVVVQFSPDSNLWANLPGNTFTVSTGASAASANNTNVTVATNWTAAQLAGFNWMRVAGTTNGNAADITSLRILTTNP